MNFFIGFKGHIIPSLVGWFRYLVKSPLTALKLLTLRLGFLATRKLLFKFSDRRGYSIATHQELVSYWDFFVERSFYDPEWADAFVKSEHPVAIDVGANAGIFSYFLTTLNPKTEIFAFEPLPEMRKKIEKIEAVSGCKIHIFTAACGREKGVATLCFDEHEDTNAYLNLAEVDNASYNAKKNQVTVEILAIDDVVPDGEIILLKVDAESYEVIVLEGALRTLARTRHLIVEVNGDDDFSRIKKTLGAGWQGRPLTSNDYLFSRT